MIYSELRNILKSSIQESGHFSDFKLSLSPTGFSLNKHTKYEYFSIWGNTRKYPEKLFVDYLHSGIGYKVVEDLLIPILVNHDFLGSGALTYPSYTVGIDKEFPELNPKKLNLPMEIKTSEDINEFIPILHNFSELYVIPFHSKWSDFSKLIPILENLNDTELETYFSTGGVFRKIIIYKLANHPDYLSYYNSQYEKYNTLSITYPDASYPKKFIEALKELNSKLN